MMIHSTGPYSLVVLLPQRELPLRGQRPELSDDAWTRRLALNAMEKAGIGTDGVVEVEAFCGQGGMMIFASLRSDTRYDTLYYQFDSLEDVLQLSGRLRRDPPRKSDLTYINEKYILSLSAPAKEAVRLSYVAGEFGRRLYRPAGFARYLSEHGKTVIAGTAVQKLAEI